MGMLVIRKYMGGIFMNNQVKEIIEEMKKEKKRLSMEMEHLKKEIILKKQYIKEKEERIQKIKELMNKLTSQNSKERTNEKKPKAKKITMTELRKCKRKTMVETIQEMLRNREMHYKDIIYNLRLLGFTLETKQPELNIVSLLCRDDRFVRVGKGTYTATQKEMKNAG